MTRRLLRHERTSAFLASRGDAELAALVEAAPPGEVGVGGGSTTLDVRGVPVFVKRVPLSDRELAHPHSTANLFELPLFCQYGIGSPGFGAWRELAANRLVTDAALAGETSSFPLLYHWRVLAGRSPVAAEHADLDAAAATLGGSPAVRARLAASVAATHSLVLFFEYLRTRCSTGCATTRSARRRHSSGSCPRSWRFLRGRELLHMDGHFANLRTDGAGRLPRRLRTGHLAPLRAVPGRTRLRRAPRSPTTPRTRPCAWSTGWSTAVCGVPVPAGGAPVARNEYVRRCAAGHLPDDVPRAVAEILARHAPAAARMNSFYWSLFGGDLDTDYPAGELRPAFRPAPP